MSTTIDQKVVEMRFDNRHFEQHTRESMSTLDKLKQKLNFKDSAKGLEELNNSANKVDMRGMTGALETVRTKFSALEVIGVTALANITNSAVNAGKALIKSLTIDNVASGWSKFEQKTANVQTIMNATGKSVEEVNEYLDKLMWFSDETSYGFTDMTSALATMVSSGGDINKLIPLITGVANATAFAGKGAAEFSRVMQYGVNQAYSMGYMQVQDWKTIEGATVNSKQLMESLIEAGVALGKIKKGEVTIKNFRTSLKDKWLDTSVMEKGFGKFSTFSEAVSRFVNGDLDGFSDEIKALYDPDKIQTAADAMDVLEGHYDELGVKAFRSAQEAKSFTEAVEATKDAMGSSFLRIFESIFGNYEQSKKIWTALTNTLYDLFVQPVVDFEEGLAKALSYNPFEAILKKLEDSGIGKMAKKIDGISNSLEYYQKMVNKVWRGDYKNQPVRSGLMEAEGHNYKTIQSLVNLGYRHKLTTEEVAAAEKKYGAAVVETTQAVEKLSDEQLRNAGLTNEEIEMYRELEKQSEKSGKSIDELIKSMETKDGRTLLIESFTNVGSSIVKILQAIGTAWNDAFGLNPVKLYNLISGLNEFSQKLKMSDKTAEKLTRTFKGVFAIIDLLSMVLGGGLRIALFVVKSILSAFNMDILDFTALVGDSITKLRDWIEEHNYLGMAIEKVTKFITKIVTAVKNWIVNNETIMNGISKFKEEMKGFGGGIKTWLKGLREAENVPLYIIKGLINGLLKGAGSIIEVVMAIGKGLIEGICEVLGIHSPSKEFEEIGKNSVKGLINGFEELAPTLFNVIKRIGAKLLSFFEGIDIGHVLIAGGLVGAFKIIDIIKNVTKPFDGLNNILNNVAGVVASAKKVLDNLGGMFKDVGKAQKMKAMASVLKSIALVIGVLVASVYLLSKLEPGKLWSAIGAVAVLTVLVAGLYTLINVLGSGKKSFKSSLQSIILLGSITSAIFKLALSTMMLALLPVGKMWSAVGAIAVLSLIAGGLYFLIQKVNDGPSSIKSTIKTVLALSAVANALFMMALAVRILATADPAQLATAILGFTYMVTVMGLLLVAFGTIAKDNKTTVNMSKIAGMLLAMSAAMLILAVVTRLIAGLSVSDMLKGGAFMLAFAGFVKLIVMAASVDKDKAVYKIGGMLLAISVAMLLMVAVIKLVSLLKIGELVKGAAFMLGFVGFVKLLVSILKVGKEQTMAKVGATILAISVALLLMTAVMKIIGGMDVGALIKGAVGIMYLTAIVALLVNIVKNSTDAPKIAGVLVAISVAIGIMALATKLLSTIDTMGLIKGLSAITLLSLVMITMIKAASEIKGGMGSLIVMTVAIGVMAIAVAALSNIPFNKLASATAGLGVLMGMFAVMTKATENASKAVGSLIILTLVVGLLGGILIGLSKLPIDQTLGAATALSLLLGVITGVTILLSKTGGLNAKALLGILGLAAICGLLYIVVDVLKRMDGLQNGAQNATVLGAFLGVLSIVLLLTAAVGAIYTATAGVAATGLLGMLALILMIYPILGALAIMSMIPDAISNLTALQSFLITMTAILVVLAIVGPLALVGVTAMYALTSLMVIIGVLATAIGALMTKFPELKSFLDTGLPVLIQLAGGIGKMIGAFVGGIFSQIASNLPFIGLMLSQFMINAMPFIQGAKLIDDKLVSSVGSLAAAVLLLTAADLITGIASFLSGGSSFATLGTELSQFMINALPFIMMAKLIDPSIMEGVKTLAEAILILTGAELLQSITSFVAGESSLATFGDQLPGLAEDLNKFVTNLGTFTEAQATTVTCAGNAIKSLAEAAKEIPNEGGLWGAIVGENSLATFSSYLPGLGTNLASFVSNLGTFTEAQVTTTDCAGRAIKSLAEAAKEIPNEGGLWGAICGENSLATFSSYLPGLGTDLNSFVTNLGTFSDPQVTTVEAACTAIKSLADAADKIPNEGGLWAKIAGDNSLATFGEKLPGLATNIKNFVKNLGTFSDAQVATVNSASKAITAIAKLGSINLKTTGDDLGTFGKNMVNFAKKVKEFVTNISDVSGKNITSAIDKTKELLEMAKTVASENVESLKTFGESLKKLAKDGVSGFVEEFNGKSPKADAKKAGEDLANSVKSGITDKTETIGKEAKKAGQKAVDNFCTKDLKSDAKTAGVDLAKGFANGIKSQESIKKVSAAGTTIGKEALKAAKKAIDSNSPSKEAMKIGNYFGQGLVIGIDDYQSKSYDAGYGVAEYAKNGLSKAVSKISDLMNSNIDSQPTIRPVLDLSEVESGAGYLNSMFNNGPSIGVTSNLNAISSGMNAKIQNGTNNDVVSAINKLRKDLGNVSGDTYNINGVAYADTDTDINNAVRTLVRAATIERRI